MILGNGLTMSGFGKLTLDKMFLDENTSNGKALKVLLKLKLSVGISMIN